MGGIKEIRLAIPKELSVKRYFQALSQLIPQLPYQAIEQIISAIMQAAEEGRTIFVFGNGGGAATASHIACDLNKGTITSGESRRLKVMAFTDNVPMLTAWANDAGYEHVFSEQLKNFIQAGDVVFAISASGNSTNVIQALKTAREAGAITVGICGYDGGKMNPLCDICAIVPADHMQIVEDLQHAMAHSIFLAVREKLRAGEQKTFAAGAGFPAD
jgi:D-sedoheptulose 7-phosphate isomerase